MSAGTRGSSGGQESFIASTSSMVSSDGPSNSSNPGQKYEISSNEVPEPK